MGSNAILGREFNLAVCAQLGLNPDYVRRIVIDSDYADVVRVEVTYFENVKGIDWQELLKDARFDAIVPSAKDCSSLTDEDITALYDEMIQRKQRGE